MKLSYKNVLPFAISLLSHLQKSVDEVKSQKNIDEKAFIEFVKNQISSWQPKIKGVNILDDETKKHAAIFIAGIALNLIRGQQQNE